MKKPFLFDLQMFGPAVIPIASLALGLFGVGESISQSNQANGAASAATAAQNQELATVNAQIQQLEQPVSPTPYINAEKGAAATFKSQAGGVPNIGAQVQALFGSGLSNALNAAYNQYNSNLTSAAQLAQQNGIQYWGESARAGSAAAGDASNLSTSITGALNAASKLFPSGGGLTSSTPTGASTGATVFNPASASSPANVPSATGFDPTDPATTYA